MRFTPLKNIRSTAVLGGAIALASVGLFYVIDSAFPVDYQNKVQVQVQGQEQPISQGDAEVPIIVNADGSPYDASAASVQMDGADEQIVDFESEDGGSPDDYNPQGGDDWGALEMDYPTAGEGRIE